VVLEEVDGCWNAAVAECQHRRPGRSSGTGTVERGRSDTGELSLWLYCGTDEKERSQPTSDDDSNKS